jgi:nucleotide-binding universal stress UspA family protein
MAMVKRILLPLDPSPYTEAVLKVGCAIARQHGAEITGLVVLDIPGIERSVGPVPMGGLYYAERLEKQKQREAQDRIDSLLEKFRATCEEEGVGHRSSEQQGSPAEWIIKESIYYDLVLVGLRTYYHFESGQKSGESLQEVLDHASTPVLGVPERVDAPFAPGAKAKYVIAFDGSLPAGRALKGFADLVDPDAAEVTLLTADDDEATAQYYLGQAEAYLNTHSIRNVKKEWTTEHIIKVVEEKYMDRADVFVLGAHSKRGLLDFMVGSLTKSLIEANRKLVLICQ